MLIKSPSAAYQSKCHVQALESTPVKESATDELRPKLVQSGEFEKYRGVVDNNEEEDNDDEELELDATGRSTLLFCQLTMKETLNPV